MRPALARPRVRLWMKLAVFAAAGVVLMHSVHLAIGNRLGSRALAMQAETLGRQVALLVAREAVDFVLVDDHVSLSELVSRTAVEDGVAYCFIVRDGEVLSTTFDGGTPAALVWLRAPDDRAPVVVTTAGGRFLDLVEPVLGGSLGEVRVGLSMEPLAATRRALAAQQGLLALAMIVLGVVAAFLFGRSLARPVGEMLTAAERFDPASVAPLPVLRARGSDEIAELARRLGEMMGRLASSHAERRAEIQRAMENERLVALGSLVAGVAHEVNNPIAGLKNCVRRLERDDLTPERRAEYLALMDESLGRLEQVVRRLLELGRPHLLQLAPATTGELAEAARRVVRAALERRRITTTVDDGGSSGPVSADRDRVLQALLNLVLNAAYVTPDGGALRLRLRARPGARGLSVEDDGPGIPAELRERVCDPFFSTKPPGEGTGLGLAVTQATARAHGGELSIECPPGGGTSVTIWLPELPAAG